MTSIHDKTSHMTDEEWEEWKEALLEERHTTYERLINCNDCEQIHSYEVGFTFEKCHKCGSTDFTEGPVNRHRNAIDISREHGSGPTKTIYDTFQI